MDIEAEIAQRIDKELDGDCGYGTGEWLASQIMPLFRRAQAEAWDEGFDAGERDVLEHETFDEPCIKNPYIEQEAGA